MAPGRAPSRSTGRELPALLACLVWVAGFEAAPAVHLAGHAARAPHAHGASTHAHGDHAHPDEDREGRDGDPEHGEGSLAHRGLAARTPPPAIPPVVPPWVVVRVPRVRAPGAPPAVSRAPARARAPPS